MARRAPAAMGALAERRASQEVREWLRAAPALRLEPYVPAHVAFARDAWPLRAAEELRSALIFRALAQASAVSPICAAWRDRFLAAARDEVFHAQLCAAIGARSGAPPAAYDPRPVRARLAPLVDPVRRACALALVEVAIGETISLALFRAGRRAAREPLTRAALERILADEVRHQRLGWAAIAGWWPALDWSQRHALQEEARRALGVMEQQIAAPALARLQAGTPFEAAYAELGVLSPDSRVEAFYAAVERLVIPRLTRLGLDGPRAWGDRYAAAEQPPRPRP
ncbi:MAG TPA: ferritin-like domain-containing protein [Polyangia bacterium]|nr:ferritin-like domain-containing protein [Polyangia bacterium]